MGTWGQVKGIVSPIINYNKSNYWFDLGTQLNHEQVEKKGWRRGLRGWTRCLHEADLAVGGKQQ